jgi:hypothetical protein
MNNQEKILRAKKLLKAISSTDDQVRARRIPASCTAVPFQAGGAAAGELNCSKFWLFVSLIY